MHSEKKISVVVAAYNEAANIGPLTERLVRTFTGMAGIEWELIYVVEGTDDTHAIAQSFAKRHPEIRILYRAEPSGLGNAFREGFGAVAADAAFIATMDADLNHQPEEIPRLITELRERNADIVVGSRKVVGAKSEGTPFWKRTLSNAVNAFMRRVMRMPVSDQTSGYRVYRAEVLQRISFANTGFAFLPEILIRAHALGYRIVEAPIRFTYRIEGDSKMTLLATALSYISLFRWRTAFRTARERADAAGKAEWDSHWSALDDDGSRRLFGWISGLVRRLAFQRAVRHFLEKYFPAEGVFCEMGCGTGESSALVPARVRRRLGLDFSVTALAAAKKTTCFDSHICADISQLPLRSGSLDGIWNLGVLEHLPRPLLVATLREFRTVLKPGGVAVVFWPARGNSSRWVLAPVEWVRTGITGKRYRFFPDEVMLSKSRQEAEEIFREAGLLPVEVDFSMRTWFIHRVVVARNTHVTALTETTPVQVQA